MTEPAPPEVQIARVNEFVRQKAAIEKVVAKYRDFSRKDLTDGQFAAQIMVAMLEGS